MSKNVWVVIVVIIVLAAGAWLFLSSRNQITAPTAAPETQIPQQTPTVTEDTNSADRVAEKLITITSAGFNPSSLTISVGETVTWMNNDNAVHTVNSSPHPTHTDYQPLNLGNIQPSSGKSLSFPMAGTYKYHDHLNPSLTATIVVE